MEAIQEHAQLEPLYLFNDVREAIDAGIFSESDILVFWGKRGKGKSSLQAKFCVDFMQDKNAKIDLENSSCVCALLNDAGISNVRPPNDHLVFVDTYVESKGFGYTKTSAYETNFLDFGLPTGKHRPALVIPFSKLAFDEIQDILDSHDGTLPKFISRAFELSRHPRLFIMLAMQRPIRLPKDVRELATFIECVKQEPKYNDYGVLLGTLWTCNIIYDNAKLEQYLSNRDESLIDLQIQFWHEGNIYQCYDPYYFLPPFYKGMENEMPVLNRCQKVEFNEVSFKTYHDRHREVPDYWYEKPGKKEKKQKEAKTDGNRKTA